MSEVEDILSFIDLVRESAPRLMTLVYAQGGCYQFHLILRRVFPAMRPFSDQNHCVSELGGHYYDITGEVTAEVHLSEGRYRLLHGEPYWGRRYYLGDERHLMPGPSEGRPD